MRIYSFSRVLALPLGIALAVLAYMEFMLYYDIVYWLLIPLIGVVILLIFSGQIDHWWNEKHPIPLTDQERKMITEFVPYYSTLSPSSKQTFEHRLSLYTGAREWKNVGGSELKDIPDDIKAVVASQAIMLTFHQEDYLLGDFDRIYTYKHPFPSPKFQFLHTVETDMEDGMILFSMEHLLVGITKPTQYYNIGMHGYAEAFLQQYPDLQYPNIDQVQWSHIEQIMGFSKEQILSVLGFEEADFMTMLIVCFFTYPANTKVVLHREYQQLEKVFSA